MTKQKEIIEVWTTLKQNLLQTIQVLKANHKDNWAVVKAKSTPQLVSIDEARLTYNLSQDRLVIIENKLDRAERRLERVRDLVANGELEKLRSLVRRGEI